MISVGSEVPKNIAAMPKMRKTIASTMDTTVAITMSPSEAVALLLMVDERPHAKQWRKRISSEIG